MKLIMTPNMIKPTTEPQRRRVITSLGDLGNIYRAGGFTHWEHNRDVDEGHARAAAAYYESHNYNAGPQPIVIACLPRALSPGNVSRAFLMDGQHRLRAGAIMGQAAAALVAVEVVYEECADEAAVRELFSLINRGAPVPARYYLELLRNFIAEVTPLIKKRWPQAVATSKAPRRPQFSDVSIATQLDNDRCRKGIQSGAITPTEFVVQLSKLCDEIENEYKTDHNSASRKYKTPAPSIILQAAIAKKFYAGIEAAWGYETADRILKQQHVEPMEIDIDAD